MDVYQRRGRILRLEASIMSATPGVPIIESDQATPAERQGTDEGLLEVGSVSGETKGSPLGNALDTSGNDFMWV